jgi:hypothetical protein
MKLPILAAIILAGSLAHAGSIVQKRLDEFLIYDIPVPSKTGTTTVMFPSEISGLFAKSVAVLDQGNAWGLISCHLFKITRGLNFHSSVCLRLHPWATN